jgi:hypothetical protein
MEVFLVWCSFADFLTTWAFIVVEDRNSCFPFCLNFSCLSSHHAVDPIVSVATLFFFGTLAHLQVWRATLSNALQVEPTNVAFVGAAVMLVARSVGSVKTIVNRKASDAALVALSGSLNCRMHVILCLLLAVSPPHTWQCYAGRPRTVLFGSAAVLFVTRSTAFAETVIARE